ncbi:ATP-binding cassette domain-containing protein [Herbaspirillum sp. RTI4]|uniref:ATP-binding cassette domain-containing protein n=1 Tax=Herbaspirillum sp. RTI4 TaxID=3048640 RepID=UPI002AB4B923|nr:ATP-binding cassette domain-containing protein [Herbaspirillum sp. RTI4]MDY7579692.1 ATP-binding cassette domain-containing protein [Herbaspirillum sp. RTI4]MEA9983019.1 ATP-binding cassette domain-containing protein [Herbaspirillum sp. RTI4]
MQTISIENNSVEQTEQAVRGVPIRIAALSKKYGGRHVLEDVALQVEAGEFVAIVGRSGCGKSTLLRLIAQLEKSDGGSIGFSDADLTPVAPEIRIMFQDSRLLPWKRVLDNVALGLPKTARSRAAAVLRQVGLEERSGEWPAVLSGGQRQRVALARALVHDPQLLLLDEPLGALDALTRIDMQQLIESLWLEQGFSAVLVTHDVQEAIVLADRVILIEDGRIALNRRIDLPRPRQRGDVRFARLEAEILARVLKQPVQALDSELGDVSFQRSVSQVQWAI